MIIDNNFWNTGPGWRVR